jgi:ATP-dependent DNA helicase PIF1
VKEILAQAGKKVVAIAPTGVAAMNIDGETIHSMFSLNPFRVLKYDDCQFLRDAKKKMLRVVTTFLIDEVSMLRPDVLDGVHWTLKKNGLPGLDQRQVIFIGDMKQLPPIIEDNTRTVMYETYDGDNFEFAKIFPNLKTETIELDEVLRQTDIEFINALNIIREGGKCDYFRQFVSDSPSGIILAPHNATVKQYNEAGLKAQQGETFTFTAVVDGEAKPEDFRLEREINVKNGCKIMYLVNSQDAPLRNGTQGIFVSHKGCHFIRVGNIDHAIHPVILTKKTYVYNKKEDTLELKEVGKIEQMPIKLAYALSIHKAQGLTFDEVTVDLRRPCFQSGQMYVALSRVRTPKGLKLLVS